MSAVRSISFTNIYYHLYLEVDLGIVSTYKQNSNKVKRKELELLKKLFTEWDLETWANVLGVFSAFFAFAAFIVGLFVKSEIDKLKTKYIFDKRIKVHIKKLQEASATINSLLNDYDENRAQIRTEIGVIQAELEDIIPKLGAGQRRKCKKLVSFIKGRKKGDFVQQSNVSNSSLFTHISKYWYRVFQTSYDDIWVIYNLLIEIIRQIENIKKNTDNSL